MSNKEEIKPKLTRKSKSVLSINLRSISNAITRKRDDDSSLEDDYDDEFDFGEPLLASPGRKTADSGVVFPTKGSPMMEKAAVENPLPRRRTFSNLFGLLKTGNSMLSQDERSGWPKFRPEDDSDDGESSLYSPTSASSTSFGQGASMIASYFELCTNKKAPTEPFEAVNYCIDNLTDILKSLELLPINIRRSADVEGVNKKITDACNILKEYCEIVGDSLTDTSTLDLPAKLNELEVISFLEQASAIIRKHNFLTPPSPLQLSTEPKSVNVLQLSDTCLESCSSLKDFLRNLVDNADSIHCVSDAKSSTRLFRDAFEEKNSASTQKSGSHSLRSAQESLASIIKSEARTKSAKSKSMPVLLKPSSSESLEGIKTLECGQEKLNTITGSASKLSNEKDSKGDQAPEELFPMTLRGICEKICATDPVEDIRFSRSVLLCFRHWCEPAELVQLLREIYKDSVRSSTQAINVSIEKNLLAFLELWTKVYWDFAIDRSALDRIIELLTDIGEECGAEKPVTLVNYCRDVLARSKVHTTQFSAPAIEETTVPSSIFPTRRSLAIEFIDVNMTFPLHTNRFGLIKPCHFAHPVALRELAKQITLLQNDLFLRIDPLSFVNSRVKKGQSTPKALTEFNDFSFRLLCWVEDELLSGKTQVDRLNVFELFTQLAVECVRLRNHESAHSIYVALENALDCAAIPMLSSELYNAFNYLGDIFSCFNIPRGRSRKILLSEEGPCVPVFSTFDMRIVKIQEHKSVIDAKSKGKLLNVPDYIRLADIAIEIKDSQKKYAYAEHPALQGFIKNRIENTLDEESRMKKRAFFDRLSYQTPEKFKLLKTLKGLYRRKAADGN